MLDDSVNERVAQAALDRVRSPLLTQDNLAPGATVFLGQRGHATSDGGPSTVWVIDTLSESVTETLPVGDQSFDNLGGIALAPDGSVAYVVVTRNSNYVALIDTVTDSIVGTISPITTHDCDTGDNDGCPHDIAVTADGSKAYVTVVGSPTAGEVAVLNLETPNPVWVDTIRVGRGFRKLYPTGWV